MADAAKKQSLRNVLYVGAVQAATLLVPLITLPWILRALGPGAYGQYAVALAIGQYGLIFVDFGFNLSGVKRVSQSKDRQELTRYFWTAQTIRGVIAVLTAAVSLLIVLVVPSLRPTLPVTAAYQSVLIGSLFYPQWLFVGLERIRVVSLIHLVSRFSTVVPLIVLVRTPEDAWLAGFLSASSMLLGAFLSTLLILKWRMIGPFVMPTLSQMLEVAREAMPLFRANAAVALYSAWNPILLSLVTSSAQVGLFNAAARLRSAAEIPIGGFHTVFLPRLNRRLDDGRDAALNMLAMLLVVLVPVGAIISLTLYFSTPLIVHILMGEAFYGAVLPLQILSILPFMSGINTVLGPLTMITFNLTRQLSRILISAGLLNVLMLLSFGRQHGAAGAASAVAITEVLITMMIAVVLYRDGLLGEISAAVVRTLCPKAFQR